MRKLIIEQIVHFVPYGQGPIFKGVIRFPVEETDLFPSLMVQLSPRTYNDIRHRVEDGELWIQVKMYPANTEGFTVE